MLGWMLCGFAGLLVIIIVLDKIKAKMRLNKVKKAVIKTVMHIAELGGSWCGAKRQWRGVSGSLKSMSI